MASGVNKVILLGNVGKDPEFKVLASGASIVNFSLATSERFKDRGGESQERTEWHNCLAFERTAEVIRDYVKKGSKLFIEGKIQTRSWEDQSSGEKKYRTGIVVLQLRLLSSNDQHNVPVQSRDRSVATSRAAGNGRKGQAATQDDYGEVGITDEDIPF